jgi:poly(3-hydroxybutyrate) depolymerase
MTIFASVLFLVTQTGLAQSKGDPRDFAAREYKDSDGNALLYRLFTPKDYDASKKYPLILFLHGAGERGSDNTAQVRDALHFTRPDIQNQHPCFVVAPQCPSQKPAFQVAGAQKTYDQTYNGYEKVGEWKRYVIELSKLPGGTKTYLTLINAELRQPARDPQRKDEPPKPEPAVGEFRNIAVFEGDPLAGAVPPMDLRKMSFDKKQGNGKATVSEDGTTLTLSGAIRVKAPLEYKVTSKSILTFEFRSPQLGAAHAIGLDPDEFFDWRWANMDWSAKKGSMAKEASTPLRLTLEALERLRKEFNIDADRIYIAGLSMGGYGTWDAISRNPTLFAAAVPVCGGGDEAMADKIKDIPIWCFHGDADNAVPVARSRQMINAIKAAGGTPKYTEYPGVGHNSWDKAYAEPELAKWLFEQKRK